MCRRLAGVGVLALCVAVAGAQTQAFQPQQPPLAVRIVAPGSGGTDVQPAPPRTWIGVRVTPLPAPLAAHIGTEGLLVVNVIAGSPADDAGIEQYDVLRRLGDRDANSLEDLVMIIRDGGAQPMALEIVRGGAKQRLAITPTERLNQPNPIWKYAEPPQQFITDSLDFQGSKLQRTPSGDWILQQLGGLEDMPEQLKGLFEMRMRTQPAPGFGAFPGEHGVIIRPTPGPGGQCGLNAPTIIGDRAPLAQSFLDVSNGQMVLNVQIMDEDGKLSVRRDSDGKVHVEREKLDGERSTTTYENAEEFAAKDPEAAAKCPGVQGAPLTVFFGPPDAEQAEKMRREIMDQLAGLGKCAPGPGVAPPPKVADEAGPSDFSVTVGSDGRITAELRKASGVLRYEFANDDEFRRSQPGLFDRYQQMIHE